MSIFKHPLGSKVKDRITGVQGIIVGRTEWMYGCVRYSVQPVELKDGKPVDHIGFDEDQLMVLELPTAEITGVSEKEQPTGGPKEEPQRRSAVNRF